jgi:hypothetical protein
MQNNNTQSEVIDTKAVQNMSSVTQSRPEFKLPIGLSEELVINTY